MGFLCFVRYSFQEIACRLRMYRWKLILCIAVSLAGFVLGIALFCTCGYGWWYYNRCNFACKITEAGFSVLLTFIIAAAVIYVLLTLCSMLRQTHFLAYLVNLLACFYCGATLAAIFVYSTVWGILYAVFVAVLWLATICLSCFVCISELHINRCFGEAVSDMKLTAFVLTAGVIYKIIALFVILKILTMLI